MESINVVINDVPKEKIPDAGTDVETSVQETNAPVQLNESNLRKKKSKKLSKIRCLLLKVPL